jgi:hypothetical protein
MLAAAVGGQSFTKNPEPSANDADDWPLAPALRNMFLSVWVSVTTFDSWASISGLPKAQQMHLGRKVVQLNPDLALPLGRSLRQFRKQLLESIENGHRLLGRHAITSAPTERGGNARPVTFGTNWLDWRLESARQERSAAALVRRRESASEPAGTARARTDRASAGDS